MRATPSGLKGVRKLQTNVANSSAVATFSSGGGGVATFGANLVFPGIVGAPPSVAVQGLGTGGIAGGFGQADGVAIGEVNGLIPALGVGVAFGGGFGNAVGNSVDFGSAGGSGSGLAVGFGGAAGGADNLMTPGFVAFNASSGSASNGFAGGFVGPSPQIPDFATSFNSLGLGFGLPTP
jgi:hypothetical protein